MKSVQFCLSINTVLIIILDGARRGDICRLFVRESVCRNHAIQNTVPSTVWYSTALLNSTCTVARLWLMIWKMVHTHEIEIDINDGQICPGLSLLFNSISGPQVCVRPVLDHYRKDGAENTSSCWIKDWLNTQTSIGPFEICWMNVDLLWLDSKSAKPNYHKLKAFCFSNLLIESVQLSFFLSFSFLYRIEPDWVDGRMMAQIKSFCPSQTLQANWSPT